MCLYQFKFLFGLLNSQFPRPSAQSSEKIWCESARMKRLSRANVSHTRRRLMRASKMRYIFRRGRNLVAETIARWQRGRRGGGGGRKRHLHSAHTQGRKIGWFGRRQMRRADMQLPLIREEVFALLCPDPAVSKRCTRGINAPRGNCCFVYITLCVSGGRGEACNAQRDCYTLFVSLFLC